MGDIMGDTDNAEEFTGVQRITVSNLRKKDEAPRVILEPDPSAGATRAIIPFVDLAELADALKLFFAGQLDDVEPQNVNEPLDRLVPGKPLISRLTSEDILKAFDEISPNDTATLHYFNQPEILGGQNTPQNTEYYRAAVERLGEVVARSL
jgi:hypothetical protein